MKRLFQSPFSLLCLGLFVACGAGDGSSKDDPGGKSPVPLPLPGTKKPGTSIKDLWNDPPSLNCGDGVLDENEACDDGNQDPDDGCHSNCLVINPGYICPEAGQPCKPFARCGDGVLISPEQCDDGNLEAGDGCSASCKVEIGYACAGSPSECIPTVCGDNILEGAETCDDGNAIPGDGCDDRCQLEPGCTSDGCTSICGDGIVLGDEECDDGNTTPGDGCSAECKVERGYTCEQPSCTSGENCFMEVPVIYRDFTSAHSDFGNSHNPQTWRECDAESRYAACDRQFPECNCVWEEASCQECHRKRNDCRKPVDDCLGGAGCDGFAPGVADARLDSKKKPQLASNPKNVCIQNEKSYAEWFRETPGKNATIVQRLSLFPNGRGGFVNRYGAQGEKWIGTETRWCSETAGSGCGANTGCSDGQWLECSDPCAAWGNQKVCALYSKGKSYDGNPVFFPIDGHPAALPEERFIAKIPAPVYEGNWDSEWGGPLHNFYFTSEVTHWFQYQAGARANLTFVGDDDVWVFLNEQLVVDLGGIHVPIEGSLNIAANGTVTMTTPHGSQQRTVAQLGMKDGHVYEIKVFHAERKRDGSSFQLTLSGFNTARSECTAICGDGIVGIGEECDEGENNGSGYNRCQTNCTLAGFCGDGIRQENEQCDDNDPAETRTCSGCRYLEIR